MYFEGTIYVSRDLALLSWGHDFLSWERKSFFFSIMSATGFCSKVIDTEEVVRVNCNFDHKIMWKTCNMQLYITCEQCQCSQVSAEILFTGLTDNFIGSRTLHWGVLVWHSRAEFMGREWWTVLSCHRYDEATLFAAAGFWFFTVPWLQAPTVMSGCGSSNCFPHANREDEGPGAGFSRHLSVTEEQWVRKQPQTQQSPPVAKRGDAWLDCDC